MSPRSSLLTLHHGQAYVPILLFSPSKSCINFMLPTEMNTLELMSFISSNRGPFLDLYNFKYRRQKKTKINLEGQNYVQFEVILSRNVKNI